MKNMDIQKIFKGVFSRSPLISLYHHVIIVNTHANNS